MAAINTGLEHVTHVDTGTRDADAMVMTLWSAGALMETLILVGGVLWVLNGPGAISVYARVALVALFAVLGGGVFVVTAAKMNKPGD